MPVYLPFPLIFCIFVPLLLACFVAKTQGYVLKCRGVQMGISSISLNDVSYNHKKVYSVSAPQISIQFHIPRPSDTKFITVKIHDYTYKDNQHHITIADIDLRIQLAPQAPETTAMVILDDFRVRVYHSAKTPIWMQQTRANLITTWLNGQYLRLDDLVMKLTLCTNTGQTPTVVVPASNEKSGLQGTTYVQRSVNEEEVETQQDPDLADEAMLSAFATEWYIANVRNRLYSFGAVHAQLRHSWDPMEDRGTFVFVMQNCNWALCPNDIGLVVGGKVRPGTPSDIPARPGQLKPFSRVSDLVKAPFRLMKFLIKLWRDPFNVVTLHSPRVDVTFDRFRLRDAELVKQGMVAARRQYTKFQHSDYSLDFTGFFQDMVIHSILGGR